MANAAATGLVLVAIILGLGSVSGGHPNPAVTLVARISNELSWKDAGVYASARIAGAVLGAVVANVIFGLDAISVSDHARSG